jgi:hypothetical protein
MITLFSEHFSGQKPFLYTCERDIQISAIYFRNTKNLAIASENQSETVFQRGIYRNDLTNVSEPPNEKVLPFKYTFKKGDIIKSYFTPLVNWEIANCFLIEEKDGITHFEDSQRLKGNI